ncbi:hypothetical protein Hanom_Chr14g01318331 [Helianthus anomalus]
MPSNLFQGLPPPSAPPPPPSPPPPSEQPDPVIAKDSPTPPAAALKSALKRSKPPQSEPQEKYCRKEGMMYLWSKFVLYASRARLGSSSARFKPIYLSSSSSSICDLRVKSKARAILRTISNKLKDRLVLASISLKRVKSRLELGSPMLASLLLYYIYIYILKNKILFGLV